MAYAAAGLNRFADGGAVGTAPGNRVGLYSYATADTLATVAAANYFNSAAAILKVGDIICVTAGIGGTPAMEHYIVSANTGTVVTITVEGGTP